MTTDVATLADMALQAGLNLLGAVLILIVGWFVASWVQRLILRGIRINPRADKTIGMVLARAARWAVIAITVVTVLGRFGVQTTSIVALLGAAGLAVGLALQGTLTNVAAGIMLLTLRPFNIGDAVDIAGTGGVVDDIGLFVTRMTMFDGVPAHLPNSEVWGKAIKNFSRAGRRRFDLGVGIGYGDDIALALDILRKLVEDETRVLEDPAPTLVVSSLGDSSVNLMARCWSLPADLFAVQWDLTRAVKERFDAEGISIPFPQRDLHLIQVPKSLEGAGSAQPGEAS